jgi:hypothetical protein
MRSNTRLKTDAELHRARELQVTISARDYPHAKEAKAILETILVGLGLFGDWILHLDKLVRSRSPVKFKLKTGTLTGIHVVIKPAGQDSAGLFRLTTPPGLHPVDVYNRMRIYLQSMENAKLEEGDDAEDDEDVVAEDPAASQGDPLVAPPPATIPPATLPATLPATDTVLGQLVHLQNTVQTLQFNRDMRAAYVKELQTLTEHRDLLQLELQEVLGKIQTAERQLGEIPAVSEEEYATAAARWRQVEEGLKMLRSALG